MALLLRFVSLLWAGMLIGVSFVATPVKFLAPTLTLPVALDVGRHTFTTFNMIELGFVAATVLIIVLVGPRSRTIVAATAVAGITVLSQTFWLLPLLRERTDLVVAGSAPAGSSLHVIYISVEVLKLLAILVIALAAGPRPAVVAGRRA